VKRRSFLLGGLAVAAAVGAVAIARLLGGRGAPPAPDRREAPLAPGRVFAADSEALLLAVADAVVPRVGEHRAASEIDFIPRLEGWVKSSPHRRGLYERGWPRFERQIRARTAPRGDRPDPELLAALLERWHRDYREGRGDKSARFFEQLRRDTLRAYYSSPVAWASLGYTGPVQREAFPAEPGP
jgi:hypothetical protein